jgi:hypothetical protein
MKDGFKRPMVLFCFEEGERFFGLFGFLLLPMFSPKMF